MDKHDQDPSRLSGKHARRARAAAWSAGLSLFGGTSIVEAIAAHPAAAGIELAQEAEQSPNSLIAGVDKKLLQLKDDMKSAPGLKIINGADKRLNSTPSVNVYFLSAPDKMHPHHYNLLELIVKNGVNNPLSVAVALDANSNVFGKAENTPNGLVVVQSDKGSFTPGTIEVWTQWGSQFNQYCVSTNNYDGNHPKFGATSDSVFKLVASSVVSRQFETFFTYANGIIDSNK